MSFSECGGAVWRGDQAPSLPRERSQIARESALVFHKVAQFTHSQWLPDKTLQKIGLVMIAHLFIGMFVAMISSIALLIAGYGLLLAFVTYSVVGSVTMVLSSLIAVGFERDAVEKTEAPLQAA